MTERLHFHFHALEKEMATHSSILTWESPWTEEPGGLQSMGSQKATEHGHTLLSVYLLLPYVTKNMLPALRLLFTDL